MVGRVAVDHRLALVEGHQAVAIDADREHDRAGLGVGRIRALAADDHAALEEQEHRVAAHRMHQPAVGAVAAGDRQLIAADRIGIGDAVVIVVLGTVVAERAHEQARKAGAGIGAKQRLVNRQGRLGAGSIERRTIVLE